MVNHASTRTTQLYDRRRDEVSLDEIERIVIYIARGSISAISYGVGRRTG
jgi:hypothetical protein